MSVDSSLEEINFVNLYDEKKSSKVKQKETLYVQNRFGSSKKLKITLSKASHSVFSLLSPTDDRCVAAGLKVPVTLQYAPESPDTHNGEVQVYVNDKLSLTIPIQAVPPSSRIRISSKLVDFGCLVAEHQVAHQSFTVSNDGSREGGFTVDTASLPPHFTLSASEGKVGPKKNLEIQVELVCKHCGPFKEEISVIPLDGGEWITVSLCGELVTRKLQLLDQDNSTDLNKISFGDTYYDTVVSRKALLFNNSPVATQYVAVLDVNGVGSEAGVDMSEGLAMACTSGGLGQTKWREQGDSPGQESVVSLNPSQGNLRPYQKTEIELLFRPTFIRSEVGWSQHQGHPVQRDYALFVKFLQVGATTKSSGLELALTGRACPVMLAFKPEGIINFGTCNTGSSSTVDLQILNESLLLPVAYQCRALAHYKCSPRVGHLLPGEVTSLPVTFTPKQLGKLNCKLNIDVMGAKREADEKLRNAAIFTSVIDLRGVGGVSMAAKKEKNVRFAHPNDLSTSIRPHDEQNEGVIITPFTRVARHTYLDPDYSPTKREATAQSLLKNTYTSFIRSRRVEREKAEKNKRHIVGASVDMNMAPAQGLSPPIPSSTDQGGGGERLLREEHMATTKDVLKETEDQLEFVKDCSTKPANKEIAAQIKKTLSPKELSQIVIDPEVVDFGSVVTNSTAVLTLSVRNRTTNHVKLKMKMAGSSVKCGDKTSLQLIVPPSSYTKLPLSMCLSDTGTVERSIEYSVNNGSSGHLPVKAHVTQLSLTLSTHTLTLTETPLARQNSGLQGSVVVSNPHNVPAFFRWLAKEGVETTIFNVLHPSGHVPANGSLECGFVCDPSYQSPDTATFQLDDGSHKDTQQNNVLTLVTEFKRPVCSFREKRVLFGTIPLNLTTSQTVHIDNTGDCHAYYKVLDTSSHPGLRVVPETGLVPRGGSATLQVLLCPENVGTVDMRVAVGLRGGKTIGLRLAGMVNQPMLYLDKELFRFGSVFCGATATHNFTVHNKGSTVAELTFELAQLPDFSLILPASEDPYNKPAARTDDAGTYHLKIPAQSTAVCQLQFCPKEVAAYDFLLPVLVNGSKAPAPPPFSWPPSRTSSFMAHSQGTDLILPSLTKTPVRRVLATSLKPPLVVANLQFDFNLAVCSDVPTPHNETLTLSNVSDVSLTWALGQTAEPDRVEDGTFQFALPSGQLFQPPLLSLEDSNTEGTECVLEPGESVNLTVLCKPRHHGQFSATLPLIVNGNMSQPYRTLVLTANLPPSTIKTTPPSIDLLPVPLGISLTAQFSVLVQGFAQAVELEVAVPPMGDGVCFSVSFPEDSKMDSSGAINLPCRLEFSSTRPVSISDTIIFSDKKTGKKKVLPFTVCADNSLFSVYKFLAQNVHLSSVTLASNIPTLVLHSQSLLGFERSSSVASRSSQESRSKEGALSVNTSITFSDMFHQDCVSAVCRWFSAYGWPDGTKCISTPSDFRLRVGNDLPKPGVKQRSCISVSRGLLVDMLTHLCGRVPPGIPLNLPPCTTASEKVNQQYSTVNTVISFLKSQGGLLWSVVPEALLDWCDYCQWLSDVGGRGGSVGFQPVGEGEFNELSTQAWAHLLMQIVKVLVLPRAVSQVSKGIKDSVQNGSALESNVYSRHERVLLAWLNYHYTQQRGNIFTNTELSLTEVLNFDVDLMDCTVFACVLASYCPFLVSSHFQQLFAEPASQEQCTHNAIILIRALRHTGIDYDLQPNDLVSPDPISLLLFTVFLCQQLPTFKSKSSPVLFEGALSTRVKNQVKLSNPSTKTLQYRVLIRGGSPGDFTAEEDTITMKGKQTCQLTVSYHARCLAPAQATLLLVAKGGQAVLGSTLAFKLDGRTTSFKPQVAVQLAACQYEGQSTTVKMTNTLEGAGHFSVSLYQVENKKLIQSMSPRSVKRLGSATPARVPTSVLQKDGDDQLHQFHCSLSQPSMQLDATKSALIPIKFVPLTTNSQHCFVVLSDPSVGDLVALLSYTVQFPRPILPHTNSLNSHTVVNTQTRTLHLKVHAGQTIEEELVIYSNNEAFESAVLEMSQWGMCQEELTRRQLTHSLRYAALSTAVAALSLERTGKKDRDHQGSEMLHFSVHASEEDHFKLPSEIAVPATSSGTAVLPVQFYSEEEGQFDCYITLQSQHDVRVIVIETTVLATGRHAHLQFSTPAMQPLTQDIPLVNPSTADWPLIVSLSGGGFSGPDCLVARALTTTTYPLTFHPRAQGNVEGVLHLLNNSDGSEHVFQLTGDATKPLAQDHIVLHATANQSLTHIVHVPNHNERTTEFRVESDLDFVSGPSTITVGGGDVVDYCLTVHPKRQGTFTGAIAFITEAVSAPQSYHDQLEAASQTTERSSYRVWFHLECIVEAAPPDHVLTLSTPALSSTTLHLTVPNPHPHSLTLEVLVEGTSLSGPDSLCIEAQGEATYPLTFSPTLHGKTTGRVVFNGSPDGELWYKLILSAEDPRPVVLPTLQCELGRTEVITITLKNPLEEPVTFSCDNSNTRHFVVTGLPEGQVVVEPHSSTEVSVIFSPSSLGTGEHMTELTFTSDQMGRQVFCVTGEGLSPTSMEPITIHAAMDASSVHIISFTNPLDRPTNFSVAMKGKDSDAFCLLLKRASCILLQPGVSVDIPIMFAPDAIYRHHVTVVLTADLSRSQYDSVECQPLCWQYPVVGQPELRPFSPGSALKISCSAKERLEKTLEVFLNDCVSSPHATPTSSATEVAAMEDTVTSDAFKFKLVCSNPQFKELIDQCTGVRLIKETNQDDKGVCLEFGIIFAPSKSFSCVCELQVTCVHNGGLWLFPLQFSARAAALDDTIIIEARGLHKESRLGFRLTSGNEHSVSFTANLTPDSDPDITVSPTSGTLPSIDTNGLLFCVTYKPATYGRPHNATLIVQSETNEWRYRIVGQPPKYARPVVPAKVQHKMNSLVRFSSPRKNFVSENINVSS